MFHRLLVPSLLAAAMLAGPALAQKPQGIASRSSSSNCSSASPMRTPIATAR